MLIDWLSLKLTRDVVPGWAGWDQLANFGDRVMRISVSTGDVLWSVAAWDSVRSDSHQISFLASESSLRIQGSPARVLGCGDTVFGFGSVSRDIAMCARAMIDYIAVRLNLPSFPPLSAFSCSRIDVTGNYDLGSLANVRVALAELRGTEGGRYRVSQTAGDTVYWSHKSKRRAAKAYSKGPHLRYLRNQSTYSGCDYSASDLLLADRLLRLEMRLGSKYFHDLRALRINWYDLDWSHWLSEFNAYFDRMIGDVEVPDMANLVNALCKLPDPTKRSQFMSESMALSVYKTWACIQTVGWQAARDMTSKATWYRHIQQLRALGFSDSDISAGRVTSFRRRVTMQPVSTWSDLRKAA